MGFFDDPGEAVRHLERELREAEPEARENWEDKEDGQVDGDNYAVNFSRMAYADETLDDDQVYYEEDYRAQKRAPKRNRKKSGCGCALLALAELAAIVAVIGWWIKWLNGSL